MPARRPKPAPKMPTFALALGAGGARGLAHIAVLEAFDELGVRPAAIAGASLAAGVGAAYAGGSPPAIAGASMAAVVGAAYAAGMPGREIRRHVTHLLRDRASVMAALIA